ncbi:MAG: HD domain-containing protein, partial [Chloroflexi bacterium]|nr:HD domain-containing protein [Chloroflexota bacterium]
HCAYGLNIIRGIPHLETAVIVVGSHHERWDGKGYPAGIAGEDIPLEARIFAVCDTLDAITSDRPYRRGRSFEEALNEIRRCSGAQFDPSVVQALEPLFPQLVNLFNHSPVPDPLPQSDVVILESSPAAAIPEDTRVAS